MNELEKLEKELLQEIQEEPQIYADTEEFCTIDPETRIITVPPSKRTLGTESDQETNRLYFKCPKMVGDNVDLSLFSLRINYQNAGNKKDQYLVEDVKEEGDNITFSWLLKRNVTAYKGNVKFILCAVKTTEDGAIKNEWNTTLNDECECLEGMEVDQTAVEEETKDIVEQLIAMMNHSAENAVRAVEAAKAEVDKEVGDFALKAQQALVDVNNAGQTQTERVQSAGTTAVENIQTTQGTAEEAVETAKFEAVQAIQAEGTTQTGAVTAEGEKQVQAVRGAAQEIIEDREQIQTNKEGIAKLKEDINGLDNVLDKKKDFPQQEIIVNMINPTHFISGTLSTDGISNEIPSALFFVTDYIKVEAGKTYAMTYFNTNFKTRYFLVPNRLVFYNSSKTFVSQATDIADLEEFKTERVNISGNTSYTKLATKQSGYIRMQFGKNLQQVMMAEGEKIEWTDIYDEADVPTVPFRYVLKNGIISEVNLTTELKKKIEAGVSKAIDDIYKLAFCKIHKNVLCIGDSLTEGYHNPDDIRVNMSYPSHMESLAGYNVTNKGQSGITALGWWNAYKDKVDFTEFDAVFIYLGTNGGLTDTISGNFETFAQTNTGGYCAIIAKIKSVNPKCKIYMIQYNNITATSQVTAKIAKKYDCVTLFVTDDSVFNLTDSKFHTDVTHYNTIGYWAFACVMLVQLEKYIEEHISEYVDLVGIGEIYRP